jgi:hypothetical protein
MTKETRLNASCRMRSPGPGFPLVHFNDSCCGSVAERRAVIFRARHLAHDRAEQERVAAAAKASSRPRSSVAAKRWERKRHVKR